MSTKKGVAAKAPKRTAKIGEIVFYFPKPEEAKVNQGARVLPAIVVNVSKDGKARLTVFTDAERNLWVKNIGQRTDATQTGVFDFNGELPEAE